MTFRIPKAAFIESAEEFSAAVESHVRELQSWADHTGRVQKTAHLPDGDPDRHEPYPPPRAHPFVEAAIRTEETEGSGIKFIADYAIEQSNPEV